MAEQARSHNCRSKRGEVGCHVVDRSDEAPVCNVGDGNEETAGKGDREEQTNHAAKSRTNLPGPCRLPRFELGIKKLRLRR